MSSLLGNFHDWTAKWDPLDHALVDGIWKSSTKLVNETGRGIERGENAVGIDHGLGEYQKNLSQKDKDSFSRWGENTLGSAAAIYGGMSAFGGGSGGVGGVGTGADAAAPNALGYGVEGSTGYTMPGTAGELNGAGLDAYGFNPDGLNAGASSGNLDIPGGQSGKMPSNIGNPMQNMGGLLGGGNKGGGSGGGYGRQNLPLMQNEKSDSQKLAELLQALQQQDQGGYA